jgi:probable phosphoglycerate mutase
MEYCLFRHGQTNWNVKGIIKSHMDDTGTHFTQTGQAQIKCITELLQNAGIQAVFSSDLYRTTETAKYISECLQLPLFFSDRFRGMNMGAFNGKPIEEFLRHEEVRNAFIDYDYPIPGGESINQLRERICSALKAIREYYSYNRVLVITHGAAISNVVSYVNRAPYQEFDYCYLKLDADSFYVGLTGRYDELLFSNTIGAELER